MKNVTKQQIKTKTNKYLINHHVYNSKSNKMKTYIVLTKKGMLRYDNK